MKTILNFGGFYGSTHSLNIDKMIEMYEEPNEETNETSEFDNYSELINDYTKCYVSFINELVGIELSFLELISPREYNFSTDKIEVECSKVDILKIIQYIKKNQLNEDFDEHANKATTSIGGYIPFYSLQDVFKSENRGILLQLLLDTIISESGDEFESYYDIQNMYELIYKY